MIDLIRLYKPLFEVKAVGENIWIVDGDAVDMDFKVFSVPFSTRMTIIRLESEGLFIHSPIRLTSSVKQAVDQLGKVAYIIAPNKLHYSFIEEWSHAYPEAQVWVAPGLEKKLLKSWAGENTFVLSQDNSPAWQREIDFLPFRGSVYIEEIVFYHKLSQTLILTDLIENIELHNPSFAQRLLFKLGDNTYPNGRTPRDLRLSFFHKKMARQCYEQMIAWQPKNITLAHGQCFFGNAMAHLPKAFFWLSP
ncbi:DUF4336 domain-containing protein [Streptococcus rifensis]